MATPVVVPTVRVAIATRLCRIKRKAITFGGSSIQEGQPPKLKSTWTRPWRVANGDKEQVYAVQDLITAEPRDVHVTRTRFFADDQLDITGDLLKVFQELKNQGECQIRRISAINELQATASSLSR